MLYGKTAALLCGYFCFYSLVINSILLHPVYQHSAAVWCDILRKKLSRKVRKQSCRFCLLTAYSNIKGPRLRQKEPYVVFLQFVDGIRNLPTKVEYEVK